MGEDRIVSCTRILIFSHFWIEKDSSKTPSFMGIAFCEILQ